MYFKLNFNLIYFFSNYKQKYLFLKNFNKNNNAAIKLFILIKMFYLFLSYYFERYIFLFFILINMPKKTNSTVKRYHLTQLPLMVPIRYDLQIQLPTASVQDSLVPTFFGTTRIDFQLTKTLNSMNAVLDKSDKKKYYRLVNFLSYFFML